MFLHASLPRTRLVSLKFNIAAEDMKWRGERVERITWCRPISRPHRMSNTWGLSTPRGCSLEDERGLLHPLLLIRYVILRRQNIILVQGLLRFHHFLEMQMRHNACIDCHEFFKSTSRLMKFLKVRLQESPSPATYVADTATAKIFFGRKIFGRKFVGQKVSVRNF